MYDPRGGQARYLTHFSDGGSGTRTRDEPLQPGDELVEDGGRYRVCVWSRRRIRRRSGTSGRSGSTAERSARDGYRVP